MLGSSRTAVCGQVPVSTENALLDEDALQRSLNALCIFGRHYVVGDDEDLDAHVEHKRGDRLDDGRLVRADRSADAYAGNFFTGSFSVCSERTPSEYGRSPTIEAASD